MVSPSRQSLKSDNSVSTHIKSPNSLDATVKEKVLSLGPIQLFVTPQAVVNQAPLSMEFSRQEFGVELPIPSPGDLPNSGIEPGSPALQADFFLPSEPPGEKHGTKKHS